MAILENHFYHKTINLYTSVFGTIFNEIKIVRSNGKVILVPLSYAGQQKHNVINEAEPDHEAAKFKNILPRMAFKLDSWEKDDSRNTNRMHRLTDATVDRSQAESMETQYNRVPYNFNYQLAAKTKNMDDLLQIVEQVLVMFNPAVQVVVNDNPDISGNTAINISLIDSSLTDDFEGAYEDSRTLEATFNFRLEGYLYMPTSPSGLIKTIYLNYYELANPDTLIDSDIITE